jgi:hypothetical protein
MPGSTDPGDGSGSDDQALDAQIKRCLRGQGPGLSGRGGCVRGSRRRFEGERPGERFGRAVFGGPRLAAITLLRGRGRAADACITSRGGEEPRRARPGQEAGRHGWNRGHFLRGRAATAISGHVPGAAGTDLRCVAGGAGHHRRSTPEHPGDRHEGDQRKPEAAGLVTHDLTSKNHEHRRISLFRYTALLGKLIEEISGIPGNRIAWGCPPAPTLSMFAWFVHSLPRCRRRVAPLGRFMVILGDRSKIFPASSRYSRRAQTFGDAGCARSARRSASLAAS